jgi:integrase
MTLGAALERYVTLKRALGAVFSVDARILRAFARRVGDVPLASISAAACQAFCQGAGPPTRFTLRKHESLRGFFRYLVGRGDLRASPLPEPAPPVRSAFRPYIYSRDELRRLFEATATLASRRALVQPETVRTLLLLLYGAGLRAGEALRLRRCDVDLAERVLTIWDTKFFKSRLVPLGASLGAALARYWSWRARLPLPGGDRAPFFATRIGQTIPLARLEQAFVRLRQQAGVRRPPSERWQPRLHDLRATFAVHRLLAWYREGADLHARLPLLATYLGHTTLAGTQTYLTLTPELLGEASRRFLRYASPAEEDTHV